MAQQTTAISKVDQLKHGLVQMKSQFETVLPKHIDAEKFVRIAQTAIAINPDLANCNRSGLYAELLKCAQDGLVPDGREATINKFGGDAAYMPMIAGICKKARNSGEIKVIDAVVVHENDDYEAWTDEKGQHFKHTKCRTGDRGAPILTFAYALTRDGGFFFEEISEAQMADIEKMSKQKSGPWKGPFKDEMRRKSAIRRLAKYRLPSSADLDDVIRRDDSFYDLPSGTQEPNPVQPATTPSHLKNVINAQAEPVEPKKPKPVAASKPKPAPEPDEPPPPMESPEDDEVPI